MMGDKIEGAGAEFCTVVTGAAGGRGVAAGEMLPELFTCGGTCPLLLRSHVRDLFL